jgi:hypothetical protein
MWWCYVVVLLVVVLVVVCARARCVCAACAHMSMCVFAYVCVCVLCAFMCGRIFQDKREPTAAFRLPLQFAGHTMLFGPLPCSYLTGSCSMQVGGREVTTHQTWCGMAQCDHKWCNVMRHSTVVNYGINLSKQRVTSPRLASVRPLSLFDH